MTAPAVSWPRSREALALPLFFGLTFALSWTVWGFRIAETRGWTTLHLPQLLAFTALPTAALLTAALTGGRAAVLAWLARLGRWRVSPRWYALALLGLIPVGGLALGLFRLGGGNVPVGTGLTLAALPAFLLNETVFMLLTEESGWRGFALPRLLRRMSPLAAGLLLGGVWGLWHLPLFFIPGEAQALYSPAAFGLLILPTSVLLTALHLRSRGSVPVAALFHAAFDGMFVLLGVGHHPALMWWLVLVVWLAAAAVYALGGLRRTLQSVGGTRLSPAPPEGVAAR